MKISDFFGAVESDPLPVYEYRHGDPAPKDWQAEQAMLSSRISHLEGQMESVIEATRRNAEAIEKLRAELGG